MKIVHFLLAVILLISLASCHVTQRGASRSGGTLAATAPPPAEIVRPSAVTAKPASEGGITRIIKPARSDNPESSPLSNPVEVCMKIEGYTVEPAKNGDNEGKGHHHILIDVPLPLPEHMNRRLAKDQHNLHLGNGADCKKVNMSPGLHIVRTIFAYGSHIPYNPAITDSVIIFVK